MVESMSQLLGKRSMHLPLRRFTLMLVLPTRTATQPILKQMQMSTKSLRMATLILVREATVAAACFPRLGLFRFFRLRFSHS